jgi:hypothetical protein
MKTTITSILMLYFIHSVLSAQPTTSTNELYHIGDVIEMINCNATLLDAGPSGENATWDFSNIGPSGGISTTTVARDTSSVFLTSDLLVTLPDGRLEHVKQNNTDSYINGIVDNSNNIVYNYFNYNASKRPFSYLTTYLDSYRVIVTAPSLVGTGYLTETGDAYGTLKLPTGVYNNVLRIKKHKIEADSTNGAVSAIYSTTSYLWFDNVHSAPLFRIDSATGLGGSAITAMYLVTPTGIGNLAGHTDSYTGHIENNELVLTGDFEHGKIYEVVLYNIIGTVVYKATFAANDNTVRMETEKRIKPGFYIVSIASRDEPGSREIIKLVKQ